MAKPLHEILDDLHVDFGKWVALSHQQTPEIEIVWNGDLDRFRDPKKKFKIKLKKEFKIKWIVVGHNPGKQERGTRNEAGLWIGRYFHPNGSSGSWTRLIVAHDVDSLKDQVLFLEKTPICSDNVEKLEDKKDHPLFTGMQERMAKAVYDLQEATGASVWIQGYPELFMTFFSKLSSRYGNTAAAKARKERVFKTPHIIKIMMSGKGFPVESLLDEGLAKALPKVEGFEYLK